MMQIGQLQAWLNTLDEENSVAIDENGLTLVELDEHGEPTGASLDIGGIAD